MTTHKLKLKRTPEEEAQHRLRKERRKEKKRKREQHRDYSPHAGPSSSSKRVHVDAGHGSPPYRKWASSDEDEMEFGPQPAHPSSSNIPPPQSHAHKPDHDTLKAEIEEQMFRQKMFDAMGDDERLDSLEARLNDFAQVPERWRTAGSGANAGKTRANVYDGDEFLTMDPRLMDEEEYAEWIRVGMYRKTHAEEYAEQQRKKAAQATRKAEEKARKAETARLEKGAEEERKRKKLERESRRLDYAREEYNRRWAALLATAGEGVGENAQPNTAAALLSFDDIPWPIAIAHRDKPEKRRHTKVGDREEDVGVPRTSISVEELTADAISSFLLPVAAAAAEMDNAAKKKERKDKLREAFLRFHPDKFEGRFMRRVKEDEWENVREAIGQVSRVLNSLMDD